MALPALVLIHGGGLAADSWDLTVEEIRRQAPELTVLAVDMPGRRSKPGDLREITIGDYVDSLVDDIESAGMKDIVVVGHSMGGLMVPGVVTKLGAQRVREMVFAAAFVPREGSSIAEGTPWIIRMVARRIAKRNMPTPTPKWMSRFLFLNGVPAHRREFMANKLYAESLRIITEKVTRRGMPADIPRTWILTRRDRALAPKVQRTYVAGLGGVQALVEIDTCHMLMVSEPERLAQILIERCRRHG